MHRLVVTLHDIQGLSHEEISKIMDCNTGTVRSRLFMLDNNFKRTIRLLELTHERVKNSRNCRLLRWKRYEQPPPGQLDHLRRRIISRLEADELIEYSWWRWLIESSREARLGVRLWRCRFRPFACGVPAIPVFEVTLPRLRSLVAMLAVTPGSGAPFQKTGSKEVRERCTSSFNTLSKHARFGFGGDAPPILNDRSGLRFSPIAPALSEP